MDRLKIMMVEYHSWNSPIQIGGHKYGAGFIGDGHEVLWIASFWHALSRFSKLAPRPAEERKAYLRGRSIRFDGGPEQYSPFTWLPHRKAPGIASPRVLSNMMRATIPSFPKWVKRNGWQEPDVLWITNPYMARVTDFVHPKLLVYRMADDLASFDNATEAVVKQEMELVNKADLILVTSDQLVEKVHAAGKEPVYLPNGVSPEAFAARDLEEPADLALIPRPRAMYIGAVDNWFDFDLLKRVAEMQQNISFVVIGPNSSGNNGLDALPNVSFLGPRAHTHIPAYLTHSDVAIIPFVKNKLTDNINPIKLFEYLAAGRPVVSTDLEQSQRMNPPVTFASGAEEFAEALQRAIDSGTDRPEFLEFARQNSWQSRYEVVREEIRCRLK